MSVVGLAFSQLTNKATATQIRILIFIGSFHSFTSVDYETGIVVRLNTVDKSYSFLTAHLLLYSTLTRPPVQVYAVPPPDLAQVGGGAGV